MDRFRALERIGTFALRAVVGVGTTGILIFGLVVLGRPCRVAALYSALIWGGALGPAITVALFVHLRHHRWLKTLGWFTLVGIAALFSTLVLVPNTMGAIQRSRRVRAIADIRSIGRLLEAGQNPTVHNDPWGHPYLIERSSLHYSVISLGECSEPDVPRGEEYPQGATEDPECDIVFSDGQFVRYPIGERL